VKYTKKQIEQAAVICSILACEPSNWWRDVARSVCGDDYIGGGKYEHDAAYDLSTEAYRECFSLEAPQRENFAEAECLLRTGWLP